MNWLRKWWGDNRELSFWETPVELYRPHWSAQFIRKTARFYLSHWQWLWVTAIAAASLLVAVLSMK